MPVPDEVYQLVRTSGNSFHAKVARWLRANGWHVIVSPYYMDQTQGKAREIDLMAEKLWPVRDPVDRAIGEVAVRLFIECKFVPSYSVFWLAEKDYESAQAMVCASVVYPRDNQHTYKHHYLTRASVAKLFATGANRAQESDPFYKALNQALNAMVSMRGGAVSVPALKAVQRTPRVVLEFPVVLCNSFDQMYAVDFEKESEPRPIAENFQLEVRYAYIDRHNTERDEYFLLDFVEFNQLDKFALAIDKDAEVAALFAAPS